MTYNRLILILCSLMMAVLSYASTGYKVGILIEGPRLYDMGFDKTLSKALESVGGKDCEAVILKAEQGAALKAQIQEIMENPEFDAVLGVGSNINTVVVDQLNSGYSLPKAMVVLLTKPEPNTGLSFPGYRQTHISMIDLMLRDLITMEELLGPTRVAIAVEGSTKPFEAAFENLVKKRRKPGLKSHLSWVSLPSFQPGWLDRFPEGTGSVYMLPFLKPSDDAMRTVLKRLMQKGYPVFSMLGDIDVNLGAFGGLNTQDAANAIARAAMLDVLELLHGRQIESPRLYLPKTQLTLNLRVAEEVGLHLEWPVLAEAVVVDVPDKDKGQPLNLKQAIDNTIRANLNLAARERELKATALDEKETRSLRKPNVQAAIVGQTVDEGHAFAALGQYQSQVVGSLQLTQLIYSEDVTAGVDSQHQVQMARMSDRDALRQDLVRESVGSYFRLLQLEAVIQIRRDDVALNRTNLQLAELRHELGAARTSEVDRWKAQLANSRALLLESLSNYRQAERLMNGMMNVPLNTKWELKKESVDVFLTQLGGIKDANQLATRNGYVELQEELVNQTLQRAPEMQALNALISAQYRELDASKKAFTRPQVQLKAEVNQVLWKDKTGGLDLGSLLGEMGTSLGTFPDTSWHVGVQVHMPVLTGGSRTVRKEKAIARLEKLEVEKEGLRLQLEARLLMALDSAAASQPEMVLRKEGADAAGRTFKAVQDAYAQGVEGLLPLLDAQNAALTLRLASRQAEYAFLQDWADVQRARGLLDNLHTP